MGRFLFNLGIVVLLSTSFLRADEPTVYDLHESSPEVGAFNDAMHRRVKNHAHIKIGKVGNGQYNRTWLNELENWDFFKDIQASPLTPGQIDTILYVCNRGDGRIATITRLYLPAFEESRKGGKARAEFPCSLTTPFAKLETLLVAQVLDQILRNPNALVARFDQVRSACPEDKLKSTECKKARDSAGRAIGLETRLAESAPILTVGGIQVAVGLNRAAPEIPNSFHEVSSGPLVMPPKGDLHAAIVWAARRRNQMLSACGWRPCSSQSENSSCRSVLPPGMEKNTGSVEPHQISVFHPTLRDAQKCDLQRQAYRDYFQRLGYTFDRYGKVLRNGKPYDFLQVGSQGQFGISEDPLDLEIMQFLNAESELVQRMIIESHYPKDSVSEEVRERNWDSGRGTVYSPKMQASSSEWKTAFQGLRESWVGVQLRNGSSVSGINCLEPQCRELQYVLEGRAMDSVRAYRKSQGKIYCVKVTDLSVDDQGQVSVKFGACDLENQTPPDDYTRKLWEESPAESTY